MLGKIINNLAFAAPVNPTVQAGNVTIDPGTITIVEQSSKQAIVDWQSFNVHPGEAVHFNQPINGAILNRIDSNSGVSHIQGSIIANGTVALVNRAGIIFGKSSFVDVANLIASTRDITNTNFMNGKYAFNIPGLRGSAIINAGRMNAARHGLVALVSNNVSNEGQIIAKAGKVILGNNAHSILDTFGDQLINFVAPKNTAEGSVIISKEDINEVLKSTINLDGYNDEGIIAVHSGLISVEAPIPYEGSYQENGGMVFISGNEIDLQDNSCIHAQGKNGGEVILKAHESLASNGTIDVTGIEHGGFIELSSDNIFKELTLEKHIAKGADSAHMGAILFDPKYLIIQTSGGSSYSAGVNNLFNNNATGTTTLTPASINTAAIAANIILQASSDVTFTDALSLSTAGRTLTVQAGRSINQNANVSTNNGAISMTANDTNAITVDRDSGAAAIAMASGTTINAGTADITLEVGSSTTSPYSPGSMSLVNLSGSNITLTASNGLTATGSIGVSTALTVDIASGTTGTISGSISGAGTFAKQGTGDLTLSGSNTFSGARAVTAGTLTISNNSGLGALAGVTTVADGATLELSSVALGDQDITLNGKGVNSIGALVGTGTSSVDGVITLSTTSYFGGTGTLVLTGTNGLVTGASTANLVKVGTGTLRLQDTANNYDGQTLINEGTIEATNLANINQNSSLGGPAAGNATISIGTSTTTGTLAYIGTAATEASNRPWVVGSAGAEFRVTNSTSRLFLQGQISGGSSSAEIATSGAGTVEFDSVAKTYSGTTRVKEGTLRLDVTNAVPTATDLIIENAGTLNLDNLNQTVASLSGSGQIVNTAGGPENFTFGNSVDTEFSGTIANNINLIKQGTSTVTLSGTNSYTQSTTINAGTLKITNPSALGSTAGGTTVNNGATLYIEGVTVVGEPLTLNGTGVTGNGALYSTGSSGWTGTVALATNSAIGNTETLDISGVVSGGFTLNKLDTGTLILSGANTYTGATTISAGILQIPTDAGLGAAPGAATPDHLLLEGGILEASASFTLNANRGIDLRSSNSAIQVDSGSTLTYNGIATGTSPLNKSGDGSLSLGGTNTYTGATNINAGTIDATAVDIIAESSSVVLADVAGVAFNLAGNNQTIKNLSGGGSTGGNINLGAGTLNVAQTSDATYAGIIAGTGGIAMDSSSTNTLTLSNTANTYSGSTTLNGGILSIAADTSLGTPPGVATPGHITFGGGMLNATANLTLNANRGIALAANGGRLGADSGITLTYDGIIAGANNLSKSGLGTVVLGGVNTYSGVTHVDAGTLSITNANSLGASSLITVSSGSTLDFDFSGTLANTNDFIINGTGANSQGALSFTGTDVTLNNTVTMASDTTIRGTSSTTMNFDGEINGNYNLTVWGNNITGNVDVLGLALGTDFCNLFGFVNGVGGQSAIDIITILNPPLIENTHFFDGIDFGGIPASEAGSSVISEDDVAIIANDLYVTVNNEKLYARKPFTPDVYKIYKDGDFRVEQFRRGPCIHFGEYIELCNR